MSTFATDQDCFRYALTAAVDRPAQHTERPAYYNTSDRRALFNLSNIKMPARCCSDTFKRFEELNRGYSLTVFECPTSSASRDGLQPVYVGDDDTRQRITLILLFDAKAGPDKAHSGYHYITVTSLAALLRGDARNEEAHCTRCLYTIAGWGLASVSISIGQSASALTAVVSSG